MYSLIGSSPLRSTSSSSNVLVPVQEQHQPIVIPDTPSPPVSVITIRSDTDEEEDSKYKPARWAVRLGWAGLSSCIRETGEHSV